jgi:oligosaccharide repeat unit polymerase
VGSTDHEPGAILSFVLLLYLVAWTAYWVARHGFTHPMTWYDSVWVLVIALHSLRLSELLTPVSAHAFWVLLAVFTTINCVFLVLQPPEDPESAEGAARRAPRAPTPAPSPVDESRLRKVWAANVLLFCLEVAWFRGFPLLWLFNGDERTYMDFGIPTLHGAVMGLNLLLFTYYAAVRPKGNWARIAISLMIPVLSVNRQVVMSMFFQWVVAAALVQGSLRGVIRKAATMTAVVLVFFVGMGSLRSDSSAFQAAAQLTSSSPALLAISWVYVYIVMAFQNAISIIDNVTTHYMGSISVATFAPSAFRILILGAERGPNLDAEVYQYIPSATFNVSGYLAEIFMDFGVVGLVVFNALLGFFGALAYANWFRNRSAPGSILYLAIFAHGLILSFFFNMFLYLPILFQFVFAWLLMRPEPSALEKPRHA